VKSYNLKNLKDLEVLSKEIFKIDAVVFLLSGDLGAGKTTFVGTFIKENLLLDDESFDEIGVMSPTFSLINSYQTKTKSIVHADMYRLSDDDFEKEELLEMIDEADYSFVEWPSKIKNMETLLKSYKVLSLEFKINLDKSRTVVFKQL
jgi:tRNA threonylcarbamoyl adenosine modification protein YjeE